MPVPAQMRPRKVLQSWKEIASYLGVTVRTVQRWEKEAKLPIHRQGTGRRSRVIADSEELDSWLRPEKSHETAPKESVSVYVWYAIAVLVVVIAAAGTWLWLGKQVEISRAIVENNALRILDSRGGLVWEHSFPPLNQPLYSPPSDTTLISDVNGDGKKEVLFNFIPAYGTPDPGRLLCYSSDGTLRWQFTYGRRRLISDREIDGNYVGVFLRIVQAGGRKFVLTCANHHLWFPAQAALLDPGTGKLVDEYWHPGGFFRLLLQDLDADGVDEVLLGGLNNPGQGVGHAALVVLKIPFSKVQIKAGAERSPFFDLTRGKEFAYILFPRLDVTTVEGKLPLIGEISVSTDKRVLIRVTTEAIHSFYYLDFKLNLAEARFTDNLVPLHDRLTTLGLLDHRMTDKEIASFRRIEYFPTAPDGNSPDVVAKMRGR